MEEVRSLVEESYWCQLNQLPKQEWAEYFDGPTGTWVGHNLEPTKLDYCGISINASLSKEEDNDIEMLNLKI